MTHPSVPIVPGPTNQQPAPQPGPAQTPPGPPRTKNSTILWICAGLVGGLLLMGGFVAALSNATSTSGGGADPDTQTAAADVSKPDCSHPSGSRQYIATMTVKNSTDRVHDYTITVAFLGGGGSQITTATARVADLKPGQSASAEAVGVVRESQLLNGCEVTTVRRA